MKASGFCGGCSQDQIRPPGIGDDPRQVGVADGVKPDLQQNEDQDLVRDVQHVAVEDREQRQADEGPIQAVRHKQGCGRSASARPSYKEGLQTIDREAQIAADRLPHLQHEQGHQREPREGAEPRGGYQSRGLPYREDVARNGFYPYKGNQVADQI